jgi:hypothetical protein
MQIKLTFKDFQNYLLSQGLSANSVPKYSGYLRSILKERYHIAKPVDDDLYVLVRDFPILQPDLGKGKKAASLDPNQKSALKVFYEWRRLLGLDPLLGELLIGGLEAADSRYLECGSVPTGFNLSKERCLTLATDTLWHLIRERLPFFLHETTEKCGLEFVDEDTMRREEPSSNASTILPACDKVWANILDLLYQALQNKTINGQTYKSILDLYRLSGELNCGCWNVYPDVVDGLTGLSSQYDPLFNSLFGQLSQILSQLEFGIHALGLYLPQEHQIHLCLPRISLLAESLHVDFEKAVATILIHEYVHHLHLSLVGQSPKGVLGHFVNESIAASVQYWASLRVDATGALAKNVEDNAQSIRSEKWPYFGEFTLHQKHKNEEDVLSYIDQEVISVSLRNYILASENIFGV